MKYTRDVLAEAVAANNSLSGVLRHFGLKPSGGSYAHIGGLIRKYDLDTSHFTGQGWRRGRTFGLRRSPDDYLRLRGPEEPRAKGPILAKALQAIGRAYRCERCGNAGLWRGVKISLHVDHVNGDRNDCRPDNLRLLCPNCHSQTSTHSQRAAVVIGAGGGSRTRTP